MESCGMTKTDRGLACLLDDPHGVETSEEEEQEVQEDRKEENCFFPSISLNTTLQDISNKSIFFMMSHFRKFNKM